MIDCKCSIGETSNGIVWRIIDRSTVKKLILVK